MYRNGIHIRYYNKGYGLNQQGCLYHSKQIGSSYKELIPHTQNNKKRIKIQIHREDAIVQQPIH
jgi:hypothetical protein